MTRTWEEKRGGEGRRRGNQEGEGGEWGGGAWYNGGRSLVQWGEELGTPVLTWIGSFWIGDNFVWITRSGARRGTQEISDMVLEGCRSVVKRR